MRIFAAALVVFLASCGIGLTPPAKAQPCQWNYSLIPLDPAGTATATYCGNIIVNGSITGRGAVNIASAASVAALKALPAPFQGETISTISYYSGLNLGGGIWYFNTTSVTTDPCGITGGVTASDGTTGRWQRVPPFERVTLSMCGAKGDHSTDDTAAIQAALNLTTSVFADCDTQHYYNFTAVLRFKGQGQILQGCGSGYAQIPGQTVFFYAGAAGGKGISFAATNATSGVNGSEGRDFDLDGNSLLNVGIEAYDTSNPLNGNWRNALRNAWIRGVNNGSSPLATPTAVYLGTSTAPNFANDFSFENGGIYLASGTGAGFDGAGSTYNIEGQSTFLGLQSAIVAEASSFWRIGMAIFHGNGYDINNKNAASIVSTGTWYETSTSGVMLCTNGCNTSFMGAHLSTSNVTHLMELSNVGGSITIIGGADNNNAGSNVLADVAPTMNACVMNSNGGPQIGGFPTGNAVTCQGPVMTYGHSNFSGTAPTAVSNAVSATCTDHCNDNAGRFTIGATPGATFTLTFAQAWTAGPVCFAQDETTTSKNPMTPTTTSTTSAIFTAAGTINAGDFISYRCTVSQ